MILDYILTFHLQDLLKILSEKDNLGYFSIKIDFLKLFESHPDIGDKVLCSPVESLPTCNRDIIKAQQNVMEYDEYKLKVLNLEYCYLKRNVHARFFGLPVCPELHRTIFPKNVDLGCFLKVTGTVVRVTQAKMLEYQRKYVCIKCKHENCVEAEFEKRYILRAPTQCQNDSPKCRSGTFTQVNLVSREHCKDYQEIKIQEQVNKLSIGTIPGSMWVVLENDLVDCCKPGDDVIICGTVRRRWRPNVQTKKAEVELVLQANYVEVCNAQRSEVVSSAPDVQDCFDEFWSKYTACPLKGRDQILMGVCTQVYGLQLVKLAVLLTVITGSNHIADDDKKSSQDDKHETRVRGQCHLLLVGDPGTGKSQLLRTGADLTARSVFTSGAGSTKAGLTCAALRAGWRAQYGMLIHAKTLMPIFRRYPLADAYSIHGREKRGNILLPAPLGETATYTINDEDGEWQLEAGALVLSDGGVCCIDEISQLREHDRTAIHEAMEQQTISIAKAGIVCKLNTRCAIIAACNPKGHYETDQPLSVNVSLGTPLLSRFDLIFILLDSKNKAWDKLVSSYILFGDSNTTISKKTWNTEKLQMYISLVGPRATKMAKSANIILQSYYMTQRKSEYRDPSRTTVRMLDSLVRLSQAHCRLMYRTTILPMDAVIAVSLVDLSMQDCTLDDTVDALHSTFQKYPDFDYLCTAKKLLTRLNLHDIWQNELLFYGKLLQIDSKTLEADIENETARLFSKFDDVSDDTIPLSASLVTSSYFKKVAKNKENVQDESGRNAVNQRLAATLKKHANLNRSDKAPLVGKKRKRKEVTVDSSKVKGKRYKAKKDEEPSSDEDFTEDQSMLKAVPSVNDAFAGLGIDFNFTSEDSCSELTTDNTKSTKSNSEEVHEKTMAVTVDSKKESSDTNSSISKSNESKSASKLKQFLFTKNCDVEKYEEKLMKPSVETLKSKENSSSSLNQRSAPSSQISIFESSDCDIDLEL